MRSIITFSLLYLANIGVDASRLLPRAECEFIQVASGQGCYQLADRCGIAPEKFEEFNPQYSLCTTLSIGQRVCCTAGELPAIRSNLDGTCKEINVDRGDNCDLLAAECEISGPELHRFNNGTTSFCNSLQIGQRICCSPGWLAPEGSPPINKDCESHLVVQGDTCAGIAREYGLSGWMKVEEFNERKTWGWGGCGNLPVGTLICVDVGDSPMPPPDPNAQCGPRVPGTEKPTNGTKIGHLNPCPGGKCCSVYGFCGTTEEFCGAV